MCINNTALRLTADSSAVVAALHRVGDKKTITTCSFTVSVLSESVKEQVLTVVQIDERDSDVGTKHLDGIRM